MNYRYAKIIINISHESVDRPFTYIIPEALKEVIFVGTGVMVPFGQGNKLKQGFVLELTDETDVPLEKLKEIDSLVKNGIDLEDNRIRLAYWLKRNYGSTMINALKTVLPVKQKVKESVKATIVRKASEEEIDSYIEDAIKKRKVAE